MVNDDPNKILDIEDIARVSHELPKSVRVAIADAVISLSRMEIAAEELIWTLTGMDPPTGRLLTAMDARPKFSISRTLLNRKMPKTAAQILPDEFWNKLSELRDYRNEIVHGVWVMLDKEIPFAVSYRTRDHRGVTGAAFPLERLQAIVNLANQIGTYFQRLEAAYVDQQKNNAGMSNP